MTRAAASALETLGELEDALEQRYWDASRLATGGRLCGAAYVLGYVAEITLKCACFRAWGFGTGEMVGRDNVVACCRLVREAGALTQHQEGYHSPVFLAELLIRLRNLLGFALPAPVARQLHAQAEIVYANWSVDFRYLGNRSAPVDFRRLYEASAWIRHSYERLRS